MSEEGLERKRLVFSKTSKFLPNAKHWVLCFSNQTFYSI